MDAPRTQLVYLCLLALFITTCVASVHNEDAPQNDENDQKLELYDGIYMSFPKNNDTGPGKVLSLEVDTGRSMSEGRGKSKSKFMKKIMPYFMIPFMIQSAITPFILGILKFMLIKAVLVGKLALTLIMFNAFKNHNSFKGRDAEIGSAHYGYHGHGMEHYSTYFNEF